MTQPRVPNCATLRVASVAILAALGLFGCAEPAPPAFYSPPWVLPTTGLPPPIPAPSYGSSGFSGPLPLDRDAIVPKSDPVTASPLPNPSPPAPSPPAATPSNTDDTQRFESLKSNLEHQTPQAATSSASAVQPASAAVGSNCTKVRTRSGFHDHYGGLNSAGDVLANCNTPTP